MTPVGLPPVGLRCAHLENPLGIAPDRVRFGWRLSGDGLQQAYQIQVLRSGGGGLGDGPPSWDSGQTLSDDSADVPYAGPPLVPGGRYEWRVRVWDAAGTASPWSDPVSFEVELGPGDWTASWIGLGPVREDFTPPSAPGRPDAVISALRPAPHLRRSFTVAGPVAAARLHVTALGLYEARLNGHRVGDAHLAPGWTDYHQRVLYQSYDVTDLIKPGENVLGAILGDGWYCGFVGFDAKRAGAHYGSAPELLAQLDITLADGTAARVVTDEEWTGRSADIRHADLLMGERQDLRLALDGWDRVAPDGADSSGWRGVHARPLDERVIAADPGVPVRVTQEIEPATVSRTAAGTYLVDFGQNLTGWLRVRATGPAGTTIRVRHAEVLDDAGALYTDNLRTARQADEYVLAGGPAGLEPHFTLHGFRYAELTGYPGEPGPGDITARVVHSDITATGSFASTEPWLDQLFRNIDWGQRGNFISVPTDCPQRDERLGWTGDAEVFWRTASYNMGLAPFSRKFAADLRGTQVGTPMYGIYAPGTSVANAGFGAGWSDAGVIVPWTSWLQSGDTRIIDQNWDAMAKYLGAIEQSNPAFLWEHDAGTPFGDWLSPEGQTKAVLVQTSYWAYDVSLMQQMAHAIGRTAEEQKYAALHDEIQKAFAAAFIRNDGFIAGADNGPSPFGRIFVANKVPSGDTQTGYVLALYMHLVPESLRAAAANRLVQKLQENGWRVGTGFLGTPYLLAVLADTGHADIAYRLLLSTEYPSWGYLVTHGATTMWERWNADKMRSDPSMNSYNHYAYGAVADWIYRYAAGIDALPAAAGFHIIRLHPNFDAKLGSLDFTFDSPYGPIHSAWTVHGSSATWDLTIPPNARGQFVLTSNQLNQFALNGTPLSQSPQIHVLSSPGGETAYEIPSGIWHFTVALKGD